MENRKTNPKKILCLVGIVTGVIFTYMGIKNGSYDPGLSLYTFGMDYYTETYKAAYQTYLGVISTVHVLSDLLAAFGLFEICFFSIKLVELSARSNKSTQSNNT